MYAVIYALTGQTETSHTLKTEHSYECKVLDLCMISSVTKQTAVIYAAKKKNPSLHLFGNFQTGKALLQDALFV